MDDINVNDASVSVVLIHFHHSRRISFPRKCPLQGRALQNTLFRLSFQFKNPDNGRYAA